MYLVAEYMQISAPNARGRYKNNIEHVNVTLN